MRKKLLQKCGAFVRTVNYKFTNKIYYDRAEMTTTSRHPKLHLHYFSSLLDRNMSHSTRNPTGFEIQAKIGTWVVTRRLRHYYIAAKRNDSAT